LADVVAPQPGHCRREDLVGGIGQYKNTWRMAHLRGPEGVVVSLAESIG